MVDKEMQSKLCLDAEQIEKTRQLIFTMANSYAGENYSCIAQLLHGICNDMTTVNHKMIVESVRGPEELVDLDLEHDIIDARGKKLLNPKKGQTEGYLDLIAERDELEDIDNDDIADKMILENDDFEEYQ